MWKIESRVAIKSMPSCIFKTLNLNVHICINIERRSTKLNLWTEILTSSVDLESAVISDLIYTFFTY